MEPTPARSELMATRGFGLSHDAWGRLVLIDSEGHRHVGVEPVRAFPISEPATWVSICDADGHEILCIEDMADLTPAVRRVLEDELATREFVPEIRRIVKVSSESNPADWDVITDRGETRFTLNNEDDVRPLGPNRALILDSKGVRYLIPDFRTLDTSSRRRLEHFL